MSQHPIEQPTQEYYDPDGPPPPPPAEQPGGSGAAKKKKRKAGATPAKQPEHPAEQPTQPLEQPTAPFDTLGAHVNEQLTVDYGGKRPDEHATERIADLAGNHLTRPLPSAGRKPAPRAPELPRPASGMVTPRPAVPKAAPGSKSRLMTGLLGIFLGGLGVHRFYLGYYGIGLAMLVGSVFLSILSLGALVWVAPAWGLVEGILYLAARKGYWSRDARGVPLHD